MPRVTDTLQESQIPSKEKLRARHLCPQVRETPWAHPPAASSPLKGWNQARGGTARSSIPKVQLRRLGAVPGAPHQACRVGNRPPELLQHPGFWSPALSSCRRRGEACSSCPPLWSRGKQKPGVASLSVALFPFLSSD